MPSRRQAIHFGHGKIEDDDVRLQPDGHFDSLPAIDGLTANFPILGCQQVAHKAPYWLMIISHENTQCNLPF
jgi:hypothetical protein